MIDKEFAEATGLRPSDLPSPHHPLMQNDEEIRTLADLIDARSDATHDPMNAHALGADDPNLDIDDALTFPHKKRSPSEADLLPNTTDFDADARTHSRPDDADDDSYMTREDFVEAMDATDPDADAGDDSRDFLPGTGIERAPDMTGTVRGIAPGMATHLPQDIGAGGFQIEEPGTEGDFPLADAADQNQAGTNADEDDGNLIPTAKPHIATHDDALDATRQME